MENLLTTSKTVSELVNDFESGLITIPEIQRDVVWKSDQVKDLVDSISKGFPCGSLIFWAPRERDEHILKSMIRPERLNQTLPRYFLLDGQQRLTALCAVILKREVLKILLNELEEEMPYIYINLRRFPNEIEATNTPDYAFPWVLYNRLFDGSLNNDVEYVKLDSRKKEDVRRYVQNFRDYKFPVQIIQDQNYTTVAEIFTRVNSQGTQLTGAEIHLAKIVPHWGGITRKFREYRKEIRSGFYDLDLNFLMRAITAVECNVPQIKKLSEKIEKEGLGKRKLDKTWSKVKTATDKLVKILKKDLLLDKSKYFTSKNALVPLVYYIASEKKSVAVNNVRRFFILAQLAEHYGSAGETTLRKDFKELTEASKPRLGLSELVDNLNREARQNNYRGLKIKPDDVSGVPSRNVILLLMYILMRQNGAVDWGDTKLCLSEIEPEKMQLHHIFPFNLMIKDKKAIERYDTVADFRSNINDIANITFLSGSGNSNIGDTAPIQYLLTKTTKNIRKAHFIPEDKTLWKTENFMDFIDERRRLIAPSMTRFIKKL